MSGKYDTTFAWDDPEKNPDGVTAQAIRLHKEGLSASLIGERLGTSRNSVIGKLHRLGYSRPGIPTGEKRSHRKRGRAIRKTGWQVNAAKSASLKKPKKATDGLWEVEGEPVPVVMHGEAIEVPVTRRKQLADLEPGECRFPYGDIETDRANFHFCADKVMPGLPYCEAHARCCYQNPNTPRRPVDKHRTGFSLPPQQPALRSLVASGKPLEAPEEVKELDFEMGEA
jgi:GcrA cell cycle regulator